MVIDKKKWSYRNCLGLLLVCCSTSSSSAQGILTDDEGARRIEAEAQDRLFSFLEIQDKAEDDCAFLVKGRTLHLSKDGTIESIDTRMLSVTDKKQKKLRMDLFSRGEFASPSNYFFNQMLIFDGVTYRSSGQGSAYFFPEDITKPGFSDEPLRRFSPFSAVVGSSGDILVQNYEPPMSGLMFVKANFVEAKREAADIVGVWSFGSPVQTTITITFSEDLDGLPTTVLWRSVKDLSARDEKERYRKTVSVSKISWIETSEGWRPSQYVINGRTADNRLELQKELKYRWIPKEERKQLFSRESIELMMSEDYFESLWKTASKAVVESEDTSK